MIKGMIYGQHLTFMTMYAPNLYSPTFISDMIYLFNNNCTQLGVMGGDMNLTLTALDKSSHSTGANLKPAEVLRIFGAETGLVDVWRDLNAIKKYCTFH